MSKRISHANELAERITRQKRQVAAKKLADRRLAKSRAVGMGGRLKIALAAILAKEQALLRASAKVFERKC